MFAKIILVLPLAVCFGTPINEEKLRSLIQRSRAIADSMPLFDSLAATPPLDNLKIKTPETANTEQMAQISPANQLAQLNLGGDLTKFIIKTVLNSLKPKPQPQPPTPVQPAPAPVSPPGPNMFNPFSLLFPGSGNRGPFGMMFSSMMMRMMEGFMELF